MPLSKSEAKQLLERLIFEETDPRDWVQDVWGLSPLMGESAAKLFDVFEALVDRASEEDLEELLENFYSEKN